MEVCRRTILELGAASLAGFSVRSRAADRATAKDLSDDLSILREALKLHPGLYRYNSPRQIDAALAELGRDFLAASTPADRYLRLSRFLARIRCGHTYCNFFNQKKALAAELFDRPTRLPFHFLWIDGAMVVSNDPTAGLPKGTRIVALNGEPPQALLNRLLPYVRADGHNDGKRLSLLEVQGTEKIETFDVFQGLLQPPRRGSHLLRAELPDGTERSFEVAAGTLAERRKHMIAETQMRADGALWTWLVQPDGVAILTMPTWALYDSKWNWKAWLSDRLDSLSGARGLIVDLRDNEGGQDCGDEILARLVDRPYTPPRMQERIRFRRTPAAIDPYLDTWDDSFRTLGVSARALPDGFYLRPATDGLDLIQPASKRLRTPVIVLISPVNSSATFQFAQNFREIAAGKLVGQTTGGNRRGINGSCFFFVRLPASGLEFDLPLVGNFPMSRQPDAGLVPDITVPRTVAAVRNGRDETLARARQLIFQ